LRHVGKDLHFCNFSEKKIRRKVKNGTRKISGKGAGGGV